MKIKLYHFEYKLIMQYNAGLFLIKHMQLITLIRDASRSRQKTRNFEKNGEISKKKRTKRGNYWCILVNDHFLWCFLDPKTRKMRRSGGREDFIENLFKSFLSLTFTIGL